MRVILIGAITLCGRISPPVMGSVVDRRLLEKMRQKTAAGLIGAGTLRVEDPEMRGRHGEFPVGWLRAIISGSGDIPIENKKIFRNGPPPLIFTSREAVENLRRRVADRARVIGLPTGPAGLSIRALCDELSGLGAESLLVEGGARLNYGVLREKVVDEILLTITPNISGDENAGTMVEGPGPLGAPFQSLELVSCESVETTGEIFLRYRVTGEGNE